MIKLADILTEQNQPVVVFVSGLTKYESVAQQAKRIDRGMTQFTVVAFKYTQMQAIIKYLEENKPAALILYSRSVSDTKTYSAYIQPEKIYAIEPYKPPSLRGIPAANMWRHPVHDYRGAGIEGNDVPNKYPHASSNGSKVTVLDYVAPLIAARIQV